MTSEDIKHQFIIIMCWAGSVPFPPVSLQRQVVCLLLRPVFISGESLHCFLVGWCTNKSYVIATSDLWLFIHASNLLSLNSPSPLPYKSWRHPHSPTQDFVRRVLLEKVTLIELLPSVKRARPPLALSMRQKATTRSKERNETVCMLTNSRDCIVTSFFLLLPLFFLSFSLSFFLFHCTQEFSCRTDKFVDNTGLTSLLTTQD